ncbi:MAG: SdrD B-like domain-containing protein, partial [Bacteroidota bacterium]|nr:SdrD B-like domain-containing protein [Bacteroidota bacterium]
TDANGDYGFTNLEPDDYVIGITAPTGYDIALQDQGADDAIDSDPDATTGKTATITISEGEDDVDEDCGLVGTGTVTCFVWEDDNGDGDQDGGEVGIDGATVELYDDSETTVFKSGNTAGGGNLTFSNVNPGDFKLKFTKPATYDNYTGKDQGGDDNIDSDADESTGFTDAFTLPAGGSKTDLGCGAHKNISISGKVWVDDNSNGEEDGVEAGEDGVDVELYLDGAGAPDETITTPAGGAYNFAGKKPGTHKIKFKKKDADHSFSPKDQGGDDTKDSDADQSTGDTDDITLGSGQSKNNVNCGQMRPLDIEVNKVVDNATPNPSDPIVFTITVTNNSGTQTATNLVVADVLNTTAFTYDAGTSSVSQGSWPATAGPWDIGTLAPGATATMNLGATFNSNGDNTASFSSQDQTETNASNNSETASVTDGSSGGGGGGIESDGSMSEQIAIRDFIRFKNNTGEVYDNPEKLMEYREHDVKSGLLVPASKLKTTNSGILDFIPEQGPVNTKAHIVTPEDLLYLSNAEEVFSVDYFEEDDTRLAALMAMTTPPGEVYNHTKMICDRLTGGSLEMLRFKDIKDHPFIMGLIKQPGGEADYFISFVVYEENGKWVVDNQWSKEWYTPAEDKQVFNFQIWSVSPQMTIDLGNEVLTRFQNDNHLSFKNDGSQQIPDVYVKSGSYNNGKLFLTIQNRVKASSITIRGKLTRAENQEQERFEYTLPVNTSTNNQIIEVPVGYIYDAGFVVKNNVNGTKDELYFADGSWSKYLAENSGSIDEYEVIAHLDNSTQSDEEYSLERGARMSGTVKSYVSLFRAIGLRNTPVNLEGYNSIEFTASGQGVVEVIITKSGVHVWGNQFRKTINLTSQDEDYQIAFDEFKNSDHNSWFTPEDVVSVIFNIVGDNVNYVSYDIEVKDLKFTKQDNSLLKDKVLGISSYPNPFVNQTTFTVKMQEQGQVRIMLYDMLGQEIDLIAETELPSGISYIDYKNDGLKAGTYFCRLYFENYSETIKVTVSR